MMRALLIIVVCLIAIGACSHGQVPPADDEHVAQLHRMNEDYVGAR